VNGGGGGSRGDKPAYGKSYIRDGQALDAAGHEKIPE
jgi:hypothetical protein